MFLYLLAVSFLLYVLCTLGIMYSYNNTSISMMVARSIIKDHNAVF